MASTAVDVADGMEATTEWMVSSSEYPLTESSPGTMAGIDRSLLNSSIHRKIINFVDLYIEGLLIISGIISNLLILAVFIRRKVKHSSDIFIRALSVTDFLILSICLNTHWINYNFNQTGKAVPLCKTILFLTTFFFDFEAWVIVSMTIDRFICVTIPFKAKTWCVPRTAWIVLGTILSITLLKNWYIIVMGGFEYNKHMGTKICTFMYDQSKLVDRVYPWFDVAWGSVLPLVLITSLNGCIIRGLKQAGQTVTNKQESNRKIRERQVTISLVVISFVFLMLTLPRKMFLLAYAYLPVPDGAARTYHAMNYQLLLSITSSLWFTNCAINIWLFSLSGSKFRKELFDFLLCRSNRVQSTSSTGTESAPSTKSSK